MRRSGVAYDAYGHQGLSGAGGGGFEFHPPWIWATFWSQVFGFGDVVGQQRGGGARAAKGDDLRYDLALSFEDMAFGKAVESLRCRRLRKARGRCHGKGAEPGSGSITCPACNGRGEQILLAGVSFRPAHVLQRCGGQGQIVKQVCRECRGEGYKQVQKRLKVTVPAGIADGNRLRVPSEGQPGLHGGPNGDLYIFFSVKEHSIFERHENDLHSHGADHCRTGGAGELRSKCRHSKARPIWPFPRVRRAARELRLKGKGVPEVQGRGRGDLVVLHRRACTDEAPCASSASCSSNLRIRLRRTTSRIRRGLFRRRSKTFSCKAACGSGNPLDLLERRLTNRHFPEFRIAGDQRRIP